MRLVGSDPPLCQHGRRRLGASAPVPIPGGRRPSRNPLPAGPRTGPPAAAARGAIRPSGHVLRARTLAARISGIRKGRRSIVPCRFGLPVSGWPLSRGTEGGGRPGRAAPPFTLNHNFSRSGPASRLISAAAGACRARPRNRAGRRTTGEAGGGTGDRVRDGPGCRTARDGWDRFGQDPGSARPGRDRFRQERRGRTGRTGTAGGNGRTAAGRTATGRTGTGEG